MTTPQFVTFTGLDAKTDPDRVQDLSTRYPIEWGILFGSRLSNRYPDTETVDGFLNLTIRRSAHLCGKYSRHAMGTASPTEDASRLDQAQDQRFGRVQVNAIHYVVDNLVQFQSVMNKPVIMQVRNKTFQSPVEGIVYLHDPSGGKGLIPAHRPPQGAAMPMVGYAGGIGPDNVRDVIARIDAHTYYLDMETRIRTDDWLDLDLCERVCQQIWH